VDTRSLIRGAVALGVSMTATTALAQLQANRQMVGRVLALQTVLMIGTTPIGGPILGVVADAVGGRAPVLIGGIAALVASGLAIVFTRRAAARDPEPVPSLQS
jgi:MFS family permease